MSDLIEQLKKSEKLCKDTYSESTIITRLTLKRIISALEESAKEPQECEWNYDGDGYYLHGNDWISGKSDFKYCPYCGRKIKVIE